MTWWHPRIPLPEPCRCLYFAVALTTEVALVRWWGAIDARACPSQQVLLLFPPPHPRTKLSDIDGTASGTPNHEEHEESSGSRDGTSVPLLLRTESIRLQDLDRTLLAEVKDVLIPHEQVVVHTDQVIGKGMEDRLGDGAGA